MDTVALLSRLRALASREGLEAGIAAEIQAAIAELSADRYERGEPIGKGGMGEVVGARDRRLHRVVAQKNILPKYASDEEMRNAFLWEAWITAQLEHPDIVPLYDSGIMADGRPFYTMRWVRSGAAGGTLTLLDMIGGVHTAAEKNAWRPTPEGWTFHGLVATLLRVCDAVAYAHARGVCHLDLKPANVLIGRFGEIAVIDWGIAKLVEADPQMEPVQKPEGIRAGDGGLGTVQYMAPEQASDRPSATATIGKRSDVFALGAILYHILANGPPLAGPPYIVFQLLRSGQFVIETPGRALRRDAQGSTWYSVRGPELDAGETPLVPRELQDLCMKALELDPEKRFANAGEMADALRSWLDGSKRRQEAEESVSSARAILPEIERLQRAAAAARVEAELRRAAIDPWKSVEEKAAVWAAEDAAVKLDLDAAVLEARFTFLAYAALAEVPDYEDAHDLLAAHYGAAHARALLNRDDRAAKLAETMRASHDFRGEGAGRLARIDLRFTAPVEWACFALREEKRRLIEVPLASGGGSAAIVEGLAAGRYRMEARSAEGVVLSLPVALRAGDSGPGLPPAGIVRDIRVPSAAALGPDDVPIPAGWMWTGGPTTVPGAGPWRRVWVAPFVIRRFAVTMGEFIAFLDDLVATGQEPLALEYQPRERGKKGGAILARTETGGFCVTIDADGDPWFDRWPAYNVHWNAASAYAAWLAQRTGLPWRLPLELEWEKAARGTDGRLYPWGDHFDPTWARIRDSAQSPKPVTVDEVPLDVSPYGVRGMAGTARDWCADAWRPGGARIEGDFPAPAAAEATERVIRGGGWSSGVNYASCAARDGDMPTSNLPHVAFRLVRALT